MASKNEEKWMVNYEALKAHVAMTGHFPDKHSTLNNWCNRREYWCRGGARKYRCACRGYNTDARKSFVFG